MTEALTAAIAAINRAEPAILVEVIEVIGSAPREAGALMLVTDTAIFGTIGGGELEWRAMQRAREALAGEAVPERLPRHVARAVPLSAVMVRSRDVQHART